METFGLLRYLLLMISQTDRDPFLNKIMLGGEKTDHFEYLNMRRKTSSHAEIPENVVLIIVS